MNAHTNRAGLLVAALLCMLTFSACNIADSPTGIEGGIVDNPANREKLRSLLFTVDLVDSLGRYVVADSLSLVRVEISRENWGTFTSEPAGLSGIRSITEGSLRLSEDSLSYLVVAPYQLTSTRFETAGDYASYLYRRIRLEPGDYMIRLSRIELPSADSSPVAIEPNAFRLITIDNDEGSVSKYIGHFRIRIN